MLNICVEAADHQTLLIMPRLKNQHIARTKPRQELSIVSVLSDKATAGAGPTPDGVNDEVSGICASRSALHQAIEGRRQADKEAALSNRSVLATVVSYVPIMTGFHFPVAGVA
jgi:hypothetical protein